MRSLQQEEAGEQTGELIYAQFWFCEKRQCPDEKPALQLSVITPAINSKKKERMSTMAVTQGVSRSAQLAFWAGSVFTVGPSWLRGMFGIIPDLYPRAANSIPQL